MELKKLIKEYEQLRRKYKLPPFKQLDEEFELRKIDDDGFLIREIMRQMCRKLRWYASILEPILNPHPDSLHALIETKILENENRKSYFELYRKIWALVYEGMLIEFKSEREIATFIKKVWREFPKLNEEMYKVMSKIVRGWRHFEEKEYLNGYLG